GRFWSLPPREILIVSNRLRISRAGNVTPSNEEVDVIRHNYIAPDCDAKFIKCSGKIFLECLMDRFQICNLSSMNCADRYKEQRPVITLENLIESRRTI